MPATGAGDPSPGFATSQTAQSDPKPPISFEANEGQTDSQVLFLSRGPGYTLFLTSTQAVLSLQRASPEEETRRNAFGSRARMSLPQAGKARRPNLAPGVLRMNLVGANPEPAVESLEPLQGRANYFVGQEPKQWHNGVPTYGKILYRDVYPGIDLVYYGQQGQLEFDFVVRPGAAPDVIRLHFEGAEALELDAAGALVVHIQGKSVQWPKPLLYQFVQGAKKQIQGDYVLRGHQEVAFEVSAYDQSRPLIIDPVLVYSSYLGGSGRDAAEAMAVDRNGNIYLTGETLSLNFPTFTAYRSTSGGSNDVFVTKLNSNGTALVYSTYFGGSGNDFGQGIAVDGSGNAYVTGQTDSTNFPTRNAFQGSLGGGASADAFLVKLGANGSNLLYSTYFGGPNSESGNAIAVDSGGKVYLTGETSSESQFPTQSPFQRLSGGGLDAFVAKFDPSALGAASLLYSSTLGGADDERGTAIAVDGSGNAYVTGEAFSLDFSTSSFPVVNALQPLYAGGGSDAFVAKVSASGSTVLFATFLGGADEDSGFGLALDASNNVYVTGSTSSSDFPTTPDAQQPVIGGSDVFYTADAFVTKIQSAGASLLYSTFLGGSIDESGSAIAVDSSGQIYVSGQTDSGDFPVTTGADQLVYGAGPADAFVAKLNPAAPGPSGLIYSTYVGGHGLDQGTGMALDTTGNFYVCGQTDSTNFFTTPGAFQPKLGGGFSDAFVAKFSSPADLSVSIVASTNPVVVNSNLTYTLRINNNGRTTFTGVTLTNFLPAGVQFLSLANDRGSCANVSGRITCNFGTMTNYASATVTIVVRTPTAGDIADTAMLSANEPEINTANNNPTLVTTVRGVADVALGQTDAPDPVFVSRNLTCSISVTNKGPWPATQVMLTDLVSPTVNFISASQSQGTYSFDFGSVIFDLGDLAVNASATVTMVVSPLTLDPITNLVTVAPFELDPNQANNTAAATTTVTGVNSPPTISAVVNQLITEDTSAGPLGFTVADLETPAANLAVAASSSNTGLVSKASFTYGGSGANRTLILLPLTNQFGSATITVTVTDGDGAATSTSFVLTVSAVNNPPTLDSVAGLTLNEDAGLQILDLTGITTGAPNENQVLRVTASNSNPGLLTNLTVNYTSPATFGTLSFKTVTNANGTALITLTVNDGAASNNLVTQSFTVTINPVNDRPTLNPIGDVNMNVNSGPQTINLSGISSGAPDEIQTLTVTATSSQPIVLPNPTVNYSSPNPTGALVLTPAPSTTGSTMVTVRVQDDGGTANGGQNSISRTFKVTVDFGPDLRILHHTNFVVLSWSTNAAGFSLESRPSLADSTAWLSVTNVPAVAGDQNVITNSLRNGNTFFRLRSP